MLGDLKVNLFIAGAAKSGTTTLYSTLASHPEICMSRIKEPNYFSSSQLKAARLYYQEPIMESYTSYSRCFHPETLQHIIGEASVSYLYYPATAQNIADYNPASKIIIIFRNPVERALSHYQMDKQLGYIRVSFEEVWNSNGIGILASAYKQYFEYGLYAKQLQQYRSVFDKNQILVLWFEDLTKDFSGLMKQISRFLDLKTSYVPENNNSHNQSMTPQGPLIAAAYQNRTLRKIIKNMLPAIFLLKIRKRFFHVSNETLSEPMKTALNTYYQKDIMQLENYTGKNLAHWYGS